MRCIHKKNIGRISDTHKDDSMVVVKSKKHGIIWVGRIKYLFSNFRREFFDIIPESAYVSDGALVIVIN